MPFTNRQLNLRELVCPQIIEQAAALVAKTLIGNVLNLVAAVGVKGKERAAFQINALNRLTLEVVEGWSLTASTPNQVGGPIPTGGRPDGHNCTEDVLFEQIFGGFGWSAGIRQSISDRFGKGRFPASARPNNAGQPFRKDQREAGKEPAVNLDLL
jgi:hypothetical protein